MSVPSSPQKYTYRVSWSEEDEGFVATVAELPSLAVVEDDFDDAFQGIRQLAVEVVEDMTAHSEPVPEPISTREFSGKFQVRVSRKLHRKLALEAAEQHVSMNRLVNDRLASEG